MSLVTHDHATSDVARAVAELGRSLRLADEASIQAAGAADAVNDLRALYMRAAGDDSESMGRSDQAAQSAWASVRASARSLDTAQQSIASYVALIAPAHKIGSSRKEAAYPTGQELTAPRRPRGVRASINFAVRQAEKGSDAYRAGQTQIENIESLLRGPGPTGTHVGEPGPSTSPAPPVPSPAQGDVIQTLAVTLAVLVKASEFGIRKLMERVRKRR